MSYRYSASIIQKLSTIFNASANSLLFNIFCKFSFIVNCPLVASNKYKYPTLLYSIRPQIPPYSILSANSLSYYVVRKFPLIIYCQQILVYSNLSASSIQQIHVSDSSIINKSANSFIYIVCKFTLILYCPQILVYSKLSANIIQQIHVSHPLFYIFNTSALILYCLQIPSYSILSANCLYNLLCPQLHSICGPKYVYCVLNTKI